MIQKVHGEWKKVRLKTGQLGEWESKVLRAVYQIQGRYNVIFSPAGIPDYWGFASRPMVAKELELPETDAILKKISRTLAFLRKEGWIMVHKIAKAGLKHGANRILILSRALKLSRYFPQGLKPVVKKIKLVGSLIYSGTSGVTGTGGDPKARELLREGLAFMKKTRGQIPKWVNKGGK